MAVDLSIVIVNWNTKDLLLQTVKSVYDNPPQNSTLEIIVVDNGSTDGSPEALASTYPEVQLIANKDNRGFGPANNQGLKIAQGRYSLMLNSDVIVLPGSLQRVLEFMDTHPQVGMCGIQLLNPDGSFQGSYTKYLNLWNEFLILSGLGRKLIHPQYPNFQQDQSQKNCRAQAIQGAFMFARTKALAEIGWLDESFFMYGEENDLGLRLSKKGWQIYYLGEIKIIHLGSQSTNKSWKKMNWQLQTSKYRLFKKHYNRLTAFAFKVLVSTIIFIKLTLFQLKRVLTPRAMEGINSNWFRWSDFRQFWRA